LSALGAERLRAFASAGDRGGVPGDHHLAGRIQVCRRHHLAGHLVLRLRARARHAVRIEPEDRGHRAGPDRHGLLHVLPATAHRPQGVREG